MGAWIETFDGLQTLTDKSSHPMWVRGLKQPYRGIDALLVCVAPHVGAWIETYLSPFYFVNGTSHPMWVRGLKQVVSHGLLL